jgi:tight adherence protein C
VDAPHGARRWIVVTIVLARTERRRLVLELRETLPDAVDLLRLGAEVGLTVPQVLTALAGHGRGPVAIGAALVLRRAGRGERLADALELLRAEPLLATLADALIDAERYGAPLTVALARLSVDARGQRRRQAELVARRLPVRLLAPLVVCALPATLVLAVVPIVAVSLQGLAW